jgi:hypothetical protein
MKNAKWYSAIGTEEQGTKIRLGRVNNTIGRSPNGHDA